MVTCIDFYNGIVVLDRVQVVPKADVAGCEFFSCCCSDNNHGNDPKQPIDGNRLRHHYLDALVTRNSTLGLWFRFKIVPRTQNAAILADSETAWTNLPLARDALDSTPGTMSTYLTPLPRRHLLGLLVHVLDLFLVVAYLLMVRVWALF